MSSSFARIPFLLKRFWLIVLWLALISVYAGADSGRSYYLDSSQGKDSNSGSHAGEAWASLQKLNAVVFQPGDRIFLRSGSEWSGRFFPKGSGRDGNPIILDRYGEGDLPVIHGEGNWESAVLLENVEYWELRNLAITNLGKTRGAGRRGLIVRAIDMGDCRGIRLQGLVIHDVNGVLRKKEGGGSAILIHNGGKRVPTRFMDLTIEDCHFYRCERNGINFRGNTHRDSWHPSLGVVVRNNLLEQIPGDGIVPIGCDGALVEYNVMRDCPDILPFGDAAAGIWPWSSDNTVIQFNEVSGHNAKWDGQGFDSDWNCIGTVIQYNYSHDNAGGFLLVCNRGDTLGSSINAGTRGTIVRYNLSINDGIREYPTKRQGWFSPVFHISGPCEDTRIHHNIILLPAKRLPEIDSTIVHFHNWGGPWPMDTRFENNLFVSPDSKGFQSGKDEGTVYSGNAFLGEFQSLPTDPQKILHLEKVPAVGEWGDGLEKLRTFLRDKEIVIDDSEITVPEFLRDIIHVK